MSLNIKNEVTCRLEGELAALMGETVTKRSRSRCMNAWSARNALTAPKPAPGILGAIAEQCARLMGSGPSAKEHGDMLYGKRGLPGVTFGTSTLLAILNRKFDAERHETMLLTAVRCRMPITNVTGKPRS